MEDNTHRIKPMLASALKAVGLRGGRVDQLHQQQLGLVRGVALTETSRSGLSTVLA